MKFSTADHHHCRRNRRRQRPPQSLWQPTVEVLMGWVARVVVTMFYISSSLIPDAHSLSSRPYQQASTATLRNRYGHHYHHRHHQIHSNGVCSVQLRFFEVLALSTDHSSDTTNEMDTGEVINIENELLWKEEDVYEEGGGGDGDNVDDDIDYYENQEWLQQNEQIDEDTGTTDYDPSELDGDDETREAGRISSDSSSPTSSEVTESLKVPRDGSWVDRATHVLLSPQLAEPWTQREFDLFEKTFYGWCRRASFGISGSGAMYQRRPAVQQEKLVRRLIEEQEAGNPLAWELNMNDIYHQLIRSWCKSGGRGTSRHCEDILDAMQEKYNSGLAKFENLKPEIRTWNFVILAYAKAKTRDSPDQAVRVLSKLQDLLQQGKTDVVPDKESYVSILRAYSYLGGPGAPKRVLQVLNRMTELADQGYSSVRPNASCHNVYLQSLTDSLTLYGADIPEIVRTAESYFQTMKQCNDPNGQPDTWTYNTLLTLLSRSGLHGSAERAETLVQEMEDMGWTPMSHTYNCLIGAYTWSQKRDRTDKAYCVLQKMKRLGEEHPQCLPDKITYNSLMNVYAKSSAENAEVVADELMKEMTERYNATGNEAIKPKTTSWNICVSCIE
jgi:Pentatricopeptide repeat domain